MAIQFTARNTRFRGGALHHLLWFCVFFTISVLVSGCGSDSEGLTAQVPRIPEQIGLDKANPEELAKRKAELCAPEKISLRFLEGDVAFHHTEQFRSFFDCANYNFQYDGLAPFFHSDASPEFLDAVMDTVNGLSSSRNSQNLTELLEPWFAKHESSGEAKVNYMLHTFADVVRNSVFRKGLPLIATMLDHGRPIWNRVLSSLARLVYDPKYPDLWSDFRLLFNILETPEDSGLLALHTREFFEFLAETSPNPEGAEVSNAKLILELLDDLNNFAVPEAGFIYWLEYANNRDVFSALYQTASVQMRGESINANLNASPEEMQAKVDLLFAGGDSAPILQLVRVVREFNKFKPTFLPAIHRWFSANKEMFHRGMFEFVGRRLIGEILSDLPIARYIAAHLKKERDNKIIFKVPGKNPGEWEEENCRRRLRCEVPSAFLIELFSEAFQSEVFSEWLEKELRTRAVDKFGKHNADLLFAYGNPPGGGEAYGDLIRQFVAIYRSPELADYTTKIFKKMGGEENELIRLDHAINTFAGSHLLEVGEVIGDFGGAYFAFGGQEDFLYDHLVNFILSTSQEAWGTSIVIDEAFRVAEIFLAEFSDKFRSESSAFTFSQWIFRSTYSSPDFIEKVVYEGKRSKVLSNLDEDVAWLRDEVGPEIFPPNSEDLRDFQMLVEQIPNFITYVESGLSRSGNNLLRVLSDRDDGKLIREWVDIISEAYDRGWIRRSLPVWKGLMDFFDEKQQRTLAANAEYMASLSTQEKATEQLRQARRQADGVDALRRFLRALLRPRNNDANFEETLLSEVVQIVGPLAKPADIVETEAWLLQLSDEVVTASDEEIESAYEFFSGEPLPENPSEEDLEADRKFRKSIAELLSEKNFPEVLVQLDLLFKDEAVLPALDFLRERVDNEEAIELLELTRKILGIRKSAP